MTVRSAESIKYKVERKALNIKKWALILISINSCGDPFKNVVYLLRNGVCIEIKLVFGVFKHG